MFFIPRPIDQLDACQSAHNEHQVFKYGFESLSEVSARIGFQDLS
jgi:hypothetical protein